MSIYNIGGKPGNLSRLKTEMKTYTTEPELDSFQNNFSIKTKNAIFRFEQVFLCGKMQYVRKAYMLNGTYRIGWIIDHDISFCMICLKDFGWFLRKHHCRACGFVVCAYCSPYSIKIDALVENKSRICENCFVSDRVKSKSSYNELNVSTNNLSKSNVLAQPKSSCKETLCETKLRLLRHRADETLLQSCAVAYRFGN